MKKGHNNFLNKNIITGKAALLFASLLLVLVSPPADAATGLVYISNEKSSDITVMDSTTYEVLRWKSVV